MLSLSINTNNGFVKDAIMSIIEATEDEINAEVAALGHEELGLRLTQMAAKYAIPAIFVDQQLTPAMRDYVLEENRKRTKQHPWRFDHLEGGFKGAQMAWRDDLPILSIRDTKIFLALCKSALERTAGI